MAGLSGEREGVLEELLEGLPVPTLVVDAGVRTRALNRAARRLIGVEPGGAPASGGDILRCLDVEGGGCGDTGECADCVVRTSVDRAMAGSEVRRERAFLNLPAGDRTGKAAFLVSAAPLQHDGRRYVVLTLENAAGAVPTRSLPPVCARCHKVRDGDGAWEPLQSYLGSHAGTEPGHGLCPECLAGKSPGSAAAPPPALGRPAGNPLSAIHYRALFTENPLPEWVYDAETLAFLEVNKAAVAHYGWSVEEFLAMTIRDIRPPEDLPSLRGALSSPLPPRSHTGLFRHRKKSGEVILVEIVSHEMTFNGRRARMVLANDVTEKHEMEISLRQAQKMEAVGQLAGGVAHDFNNLLTVIRGVIELRLADGSIAPDLRSDLEEVRTAAERAAELTRNLLAFGRRQTLRPRVVDVDGVVRETERMLRRLIRENVELVVSPAGAKPLVYADSTQLEQVLMNLVVNACDAMQDGGRIAIETAVVDLDAAAARRAEGVPPGRYVRLSVADDGSGMPPAVLSRVLEPFFTTKPRGKGTGLGLATVYGIVKQSNGALQIESSEGRGTRVAVFLPLVAEAAPEAGPRAASGGCAGGETILLVEDEEAVRAVSRRALEGYGYRVLCAANGGEAVSLAASHAGTIDALVSDVVMPGMSGPDLAKAVAARRPGIRILLVSGYTAADRRHAPGEETAFLPKPFTPEGLARALRGVLDAPDRPPPAGAAVARASTGREAGTRPAGQAPAKPGDDTRT